MHGTNGSPGNNNTQPSLHEAEGRHFSTGLGGAERASLGKRGGKEAFLWLGHFHRHECARKQLVLCARIELISSHSSDDG